MMISGIYVITNTVNGKVYIGSTTNFKSRWEQHQQSLRRDTHSNPHLQGAWNKYGEEDFEFGVLEYLDNFETLVKAEQFWMDIYREEGRELYNFGLAADNPMRGRKHTEETKWKMSRTRMGSQNALGSKRSEEQRRRISKAQRLRRSRISVSEETRHKLSEAAKGNQNFLGHKHSEETKRKISKARMGHLVSEETRRKISESKRGRKRGPISKETKRKMSESAKTRWARVRGHGKTGL